MSQIIQSQRNEKRRELYKTLQRHITNIGKSLTCPICQSTYVNPVLLPCVHAYCRDCISQALIHSPHCPTCKCKTTKRSLVESQLLAEMAKSYKQVVQSMGMAPIVYHVDFVGMTQNVSATDLPDEQVLKLHYQVSKTWQTVLEQEDASCFANDALRQQQAAVVAADQQIMLAQGHVGCDEEEVELAMEESYNTTTNVPTNAMKDKKSTSDGSMQGASSNVDSQGNAFVDAKSQDDDNASEASDETTLDNNTTTEEVQDITTLLTNQYLVMTTPATVQQQQHQETAIASHPTCPRDNKTAVLHEEEEDGLNALTNCPHPSSPLVKMPPQEQTESQGFYTAESEAEDTQGEDASLTAGGGGETTKKASRLDEQGDNDGRVAASVEQLPTGRAQSTENHTVPKQVTVHSPTTNNQVTGPKDDETFTDGAASDFLPPVDSHDKVQAPPPDDDEESILETHVRASQENPAQTEGDDEPMPDMDGPSETAGHGDEEEIMSDVEAADKRQDEMDTTSTADSAFAVGAIVQVEDRCWPGINKQGGVGRVTKVHRDDGVISYDVAYVLGRKEKKVEAVFVKEQELEQKRNRSPKPVEKEKLSPELLASLAADGFDTEGKVGLEQVKRVELKSGTKRKALNENNSGKPAADGKKKRQKKARATDTAAKKRKQLAGPTPLPTLSDNQKREYADAHYEEHFRMAESQSLISVVASSLAEHDMTMLQLLCKETKNQNVKVRTTETFNPVKTTVVVVALDPQSKADNLSSRTRTLKVMRAVLAGVPVVSPSWIASCLNEGKVVMPSADMFIRTVPVKTVDPIINPDLGASLLAARMHQGKDQGNAQLLSNVGVLLCGQYDTADGSPRKSDIQSLLRESGATIMVSVGGAMNKLKKVGDDDADKILLLCDECHHNDRCGISTGLAKEVKAALGRDSNGVLIVSSTWLFDSISCGEMASPKPFQPRNARARDLWKLCSP